MSRLTANELLFVMRVSPNIRAIFEKTPGGIVILDLVRKDTLYSFLPKYPASGRFLDILKRRKNEADSPGEPQGSQVETSRRTHLGSHPIHPARNPGWKKRSTLTSTARGISFANPRRRPL